MFDSLSRPPESGCLTLLSAPPHARMVRMHHHQAQPRAARQCRHNWRHHFLDEHVDARTQCSVVHLGNSKPCQKKKIETECSLQREIGRVAREEEEEEEGVRIAWCSAVGDARRGGGAAAAGAGEARERIRAVCALACCAKAT